MKRIITLTLNPAFDLHCFAENFAPFHENLARITDNEAGGKGVNISRALTVNGVDNLAFIVLGDENGDAFCKKLDADGMIYKSVTVSGRIRENLTLHTNGADETRISFEGFKTDASILDLTLSALLDEGLDGAIVTFTGRLPSGIGMPDVKAFLAKLKENGAKVVIDSRSFSLDDIIEVSPFLIKPNQEEISEYLGREIKSFSEVKEAASSLYLKGIENVMISLGSKGALLACESGAFVATPPSISPLSTIGAGDSSIGGFLAAVASEKSGAEALRLSVAYGTAACLTTGTRPPRKEDVTSVYEKITVSSL